MSCELKPAVLWAQRPESVFVTIDLKDVKDKTLDVTATKLSFKGTSGDGKVYGFEFEFFSEIDESKVKINSHRLIEMYLPKKEEGSWSNLCKGKLSYVKVDWNKWVDSDDEGEDFDTDGMGGMGGGMGGMPGMGGGMGGMPGMGGMGGMPGMGGMGGMPGMGGMGGMPGMEGMDFSKLMAGMGGMGGMPGMGGEEDSDDEEGLPDLDAPVADGAEQVEGSKPVVEVDTPAEATVGA